MAQIDRHKIRVLMHTPYLGVPSKCGRLSNAIGEIQVGNHPQDVIKQMTPGRNIG